MKFLEFLVGLVKVGLLAFFGLLTLGAGLCGAFGIAVSVQEGPQVGGMVAIVAFIVALVSGFVTRAVFMSIAGSTPPPNPDAKE